MAKDILKILRDNESRIMILVLAVFFIAGLYSLSGFYHYGWDESVYLHMGDYIATGGKEGMMENLRPLLFPLMISPFSDNLLACRLFVLVLGTASLWLFYIISRKLLPGSGIAWLFPALLACYPDYFINSVSVMTDVPAIFFHSLSVYLFLRRKYFLCGTACFMAFMTRLTFGIYAPIMFITLIFIEKKKILRLASFALGVVAAMPLLILNIYLFSDKTGSATSAILYPIITQFKDSTISSYVWFYQIGLSAYIVYVLRWTLLSLFAIAGVVLLFTSVKKSMAISAGNKSSRVFRLNLMAFAFMIFPLAYLVFGCPKVFMRYLLFAMPWVIYFMFLGIVETGKMIEVLGNDSHRQKNKPGSQRYYASVYYLLIFIMLIAAIASSYIMVKEVYQAPEELYTSYFFALKEVPKNTEILTAVPMMQTNGKMIIGYYNDKYFYEKLTERDYDYVYYTSQWFPCRDDDSDCLIIRARTKKYLDDNYDMHLYYAIHGGEYYIYSGRKQ